MDEPPVINRLRLMPDQPVEGCEQAPDVFLLVSSAYLTPGTVASVSLIAPTDGPHRCLCACSRTAGRPESAVLASRVPLVPLEREDGVQLVWKDAGYHAAPD